MPETTTTTDTNAPKIYTDADGTPCPEMIRGAITQAKGRIMLTLDCTALHAFLREIGLVVQGDHQRFENAPMGADVVDADAHVVTARALCRAPRGQSKWTHDLTEIYSQVPPTVAQLRKIAASVEAARDAVLAHYRPVEITIAPSALKIAKAATATESSK